MVCCFLQLTKDCNEFKAGNKVRSAVKSAKLDEQLCSVQCADMSILELSAILRRVVKSK
jgi:hypothetical protein